MACAQMRGQVLPSTVPAHRICQLLLTVLIFVDAGLHQIKGQVLSSTVPAHRMSQTLIIAFIFWDAGLHTNEGSSALKHRACAQNVLDITHSRQILGCRPARRSGVKRSQVRCLRTECVRPHS
jgi:hypothetical protein